jgi:cell wall assembly regulator SMI1
MRTYQVRVHYAAHGAAKVIAGAARQSLWAQEGWVPLGLATFGSVSRDNHVARDLAPQCVLYWRQYIPLRRQRDNHTMS